MTTATEATKGRGPMEWQVRVYEADAPFGTLPLVYAFPVPEGEEPRHWRPDFQSIGGALLISRYSGDGQAAIPWSRVARVETRLREAS